MAGLLVIDASEMVALGDRLIAAGPKIGMVLLGGVTKGGLYVEGVAKGIAPVVTGHYRRSIVSQASAIAGGAQALIRPTVPYAKWVEGGRGAIVARGRALRFMIGGTVFYRKRVGPAKGRYVMKRAFEASKGPVIRIIDADMSKALEGLV